MKYVFFIAVTVAAFVFSAAFTHAPAARHDAHLQGVFGSKKGVMDKLSCYGYNIGYLNTKNGDKVVICFDQVPESADLNVECEHISVGGYYKEKTADASGSCKGGTMKIFYVEEWKCL